MCFLANFSNQAIWLPEITIKLYLDLLKWWNPDGWIYCKIQQIRGQNTTDLNYITDLSGVTCLELARILPPKNDAQHTLGGSSRVKAHVKTIAYRNTTKTSQDKTKPKQKPKQPASQVSSNWNKQPPDPTTNRNHLTTYSYWGAAQLTT